MSPQRFADILIDGMIDGGNGPASNPAHAVQLLTVFTDALAVAGAYTDILSEERKFLADVIERVQMYMED